MVGINISALLTKYLTVQKARFSTEQLFRLNYQTMLSSKYFYTSLSQGNSSIWIFPMVDSLVRSKKGKL